MQSTSHAAFRPVSSTLNNRDKTFERQIKANHFELGTGDSDGQFTTMYTNHHNYKGDA